MALKNTPEGVVRMCCTGLLFFFNRQCKEHTREQEHTRGCCENVLHSSAVIFTRQNVLHRFAFSLPGSARNTYGIKNTPEGVVRMCCTGLLFSLPGSARNTHTALKTHQRVL